MQMASQPTTDPVAVPDLQSDTTPSAPSISAPPPNGVITITPATGISKRSEPVAVTELTKEAKEASVLPAADDAAAKEKNGKSFFSPTSAAAMALTSLGSGKENNNQNKRPAPGPLRRTRLFKGQGPPPPDASGGLATVSSAPEQGERAAASLQDSSRMPGDHHDQYHHREIYGPPPPHADIPPGGGWVDIAPTEPRSYDSGGYPHPPPNSYHHYPPHSSHGPPRYSSSGVEGDDPSMAPPPPHHEYPPYGASSSSSMNTAPWGPPPYSNLSRNRGGYYAVEQHDPRRSPPPEAGYYYDHPPPPSHHYSSYNPGYPPQSVPSGGPFVPPHQHGGPLDYDNRMPPGTTMMIHPDGSTSMMIHQSSSANKKIKYGSAPGSKAPGYSRKTKSLGALAERFIGVYKNSCTGSVVIVDEVAKILGVERRRIYDVVNIFESICVVCKKHKNAYSWLGLGHLDLVFGRLQAEAIQEYPEDAEKLLGHGKDKERNLALPAIPVNKMRYSRDQDSREHKSLAKLSQDFLRIFLVGHTTISLPEASDKIQGVASMEELIKLGTPRYNPPVEDNEREQKKAAARGLKTKIRRLYDIANVFLSVGLLQKVEPLTNSRRPNFRWCYPRSAKEIYSFYQKGVESPSDGGDDPTNKLRPNPEGTPEQQQQKAPSTEPLPDSTQVDKEGAQESLEDDEQKPELKDLLLMWNR